MIKPTLTRGNSGSVLMDAVITLFIILTLGLVLLIFSQRIIEFISNYEEKLQILLDTFQKDE